MKFNLILSCFVAILALVNPIQKVLIVTSLQERFSPTELRYISIKSTITAMLILIFFLYQIKINLTRRLCFSGRALLFSDYLWGCADV